LKNITKMIKAKKNGVTREFTELAWGLLPANKLGWAVETPIPADVKVKMEKTNGGKVHAGFPYPIGGHGPVEINPKTLAKGEEEMANAEAIAKEYTEIMANAKAQEEEDILAAIELYEKALILKPSPALEKIIANLYEKSKNTGE
jgi:hypothetical protein